MTRIQRAFEEVLKYPVDRKILVFVSRKGGEVRYELLRSGVNEQSPQTFARAVDRLTSNALMNRRLEGRGKRFASYLSATPAGEAIAHLLLSLSESGRIPEGLPREIRKAAQETFLGPAIVARV
jgi:hypothetical protein